MRHLFWAQWYILYIASIEQENNVDDEFIEDVRIFVLSSFLSMMIGNSIYIVT